MRKTKDAKEQILLQRAITRKIIRSTNILRSDEDNDWPETEVGSIHVIHP